MTEIDLLRALLLWSLAIAAIGSNRLFGPQNKGWNAAFGCALGLTAIGLYSSLSWLTSAWLVFCLGNLALLVRSRWATYHPFFTPVALVPSVFSVIAATWIVAGANDLRLLGYGPHFSYYAALHGTVLGCITVGAIAALADRPGPRRHLYSVAVVVCLVSFLLIAFGIDSVSALKPVGVGGLTIGVPGALGCFLVDVRKQSGLALGLAGVGLAGLAFTMMLAWQNELAAVALEDILGVRAMVSIHGVINAVVVGPCFLLAVVVSRMRSDEDAA